MPVVGVAEAVALVDVAVADPDAEDAPDGTWDDGEEFSLPEEAASVLLSLFRVRPTPRPTPRPIATISKAAKAAHSHFLFFFPLPDPDSAHLGFSLIPRAAVPAPMAATAGVMWPCSSSSSLVDNRSPLPYGTVELARPDRPGLRLPLVAPSAPVSAIPLPQLSLCVPARDGVPPIRFMLAAVESRLMSEGAGAYSDPGLPKRFASGSRKLELRSGLGEVLESGEKFGFATGS